MVWVSSHDRGKGVRIKNTRTKKTIDVIVRDFQLSQSWVWLNVIGGDCDKDLHLKKGEKVGIAENLVIGIADKWRSEDEVRIFYDCPSEYKIEKRDYSRYISK